MSFIRNTDTLVEGLQNKWFTNVRAKSAVQSDLDQLAADISAESSARSAAISSLESSLDSRLDSLEADPTTKSYVDGEISDLQGQINNVLSNVDAGALDSLSEIVSAFQSADNNLNSAISSLANSASVDLQAEESARISADNALDARLDVLEADPTTKSYVDGIQSALDGRLDVLEADPTTKAYVDGAVSAEESARISADNALDGRLDVIEGSGEGSVAKAEQDAKDYADGLDSAMDARVSVLEADPVTKTYVDTQVSNLDTKLYGGGPDSLSAWSNSINSYVDQERANAQAYADGIVASEESARISADNALDGRLDILEADPTTKAYVDGIQSALDARLDVLEADPTTKAYVDGAVSAEESARISADNALDGRLDILEGADSVEGSVAKAEKDAKDYADGIVSAEESARISADSALDGRLDILEADPTTKTYVDGEVSDLQGQIDTEKGRIDAILSAADADKDSFAEIVSLINSIDTSNDNAFASYVLSNDAALAQEVSDRQSADNALDGRLDVLEADPTTKTYVDGIQSALDARLDVLEADPVTKSYVDSGLNGKVDVTANYDIKPGIYSGGSKSSNFQIDWSNGPVQEFTLGASVTVTFANPVAGGSYLLKLIQDGTGSRQVTWPLNVEFSNGETPVLSGASKIDFVQLFYDGTKYYADSQLEDVTFATSSELSAEESARISADNALDGRLDVLEADPTTKAYVDGAVSAEESARISADNALDGRLDVLEADPTTKSYVDGIQSALDARLDVLEADPTTKAYVDGIQSALDARLDILEADPVTKAYVDAEDSTFFKKDGSRTMTGAMNMGNYGISNVGDISFVGGMKVYRQSKSANYTLVAGDYLIGVTSTTGGKVMTLPSASSVGAGKVFIIKDESGAASSTNYIRIAPQSGQTIEGQSSYDIDVAYESVMVYSDGSNWFIA